MKVGRGDDWSGRYVQSIVEFLYDCRAAADKGLKEKRTILSKCRVIPLGGGYGFDPIPINYLLPVI